MAHSDHPRPGGARSAEEPRDPGESSRSLVSVLALLVRRRRVLVGLPLAVMVAAVLLSFLMTKRFTAQSRFLPETEGQVPGELAGLAADMGLGASLGAASGESLDFYGQLIRSHELLTEVILTEYEVPIEEGRDTLRGNLLALYDIEGDTPEERLKVAKQLLEDRHITVSPYREANILVLRTDAPWPALAEAVNRRILTLVNAFNLDRRQTRAAQERDFLEERLERVRSELQEAENEVQQFVQSNRQWNEASEAALQYDRLQRQVRLAEQRYSAVIQSLDQAQVEAIRSMPVITVVDRPEGTALQTAPEPLVNGVLGLILGGGLAIAVVLGGELLSGARRTNPREYGDLRRALEEAASGIPWIGRKFRRRGPVPTVSEEPTAEPGREPEPEWSVGSVAAGMRSADR